MKHTIIIPIGKNQQAIYLCIKEFALAKLILLSSAEHVHLMKRVTKDLEKFCIPYESHMLVNADWENIFHTIRAIAEKEQQSSLLINVGVADPSAKCAATCAAFVNGIKAFDVMQGEIMMLPVLKFSYYSLVTEKKRALLQILIIGGENGFALDFLSKKAKISPPLLSYHIHGTKKVDGLKQLGLVDVLEKNGKTVVKINMLGTMLIKGDVR
jgi:hypothetical protein